MRFFLFFLLLLTTSLHSQTNVPTGFVDVTYSSGFTNLTGFCFDTTGRGYAWEKAGKVWILNSDGTKMSTPLLNISEEVGNWSEHGLMGFVLHPDFYTNGYFYVYYTVDRHYLLYYGTPNYSASSNLYNNATIDRIVRYQADVSTNYTTIVPNSRTVLIGATKQTGIPVSTPNHDGGCLMFGHDKSLLVAIGDLSLSVGGAADTGSYSGTYWAQAIADSIMPESHNVGSFRAQLLSSYGGKILRIDPLTGNGIAGNPFYDPNNPQAIISKVWALGLRNPFRCFVLDGTGSDDITAADPGVIVINDVGYNKREEISVCNYGGQNFGWPLYEGLSVQTNYMNAQTKNPDAMNPLGGGTCPANFMFKSLLKEATLDPNVQWRNPCDTSQNIPSTIKVFLHSRPVMDYYHPSAITRVPSYTGINATVLNVGDTNCSVSGPPFNGECNSGSVFYHKFDFPQQYQHAMFQCDFDSKWINCYHFDANLNLISVAPFATSTYPLLSINVNPKMGGLFYINYGGQIRRIYYTLSVNNPPVATATVNTNNGVSPFTASFSSLGSFDPDGNSLSYKWLFGDGDSSLLSSCTHTFVFTPGVPRRYDVMLIVKDSAGLSDTTIVPVFINVAPPVVNIHSIADSSIYSTVSQTLINLAATVTDTVYADSLLHYDWYVSLHHNNHAHPEPVDTDKVTYAIIGPLGCGENFYYKIELKVTNPLGLSATDVRILIPDCEPPVAAFTYNTDTVCNGQTVQFTDQSIGTNLSYSWTFEGGTPSTSISKNPVIQYNEPGLHNVDLTISNYNGSDSVIVTNAVYVNSPLPIVTNGSSVKFCKGTNVNLYGSAVGPSSWQWLLNNQLLQGYTASSATVYLPGNYSCIVTATNGCIDTSAQTIVTYFSNIDTIVTATPPSGQFCSGGSAVLTTGNPLNYTYQWYKLNAAMAGKTGSSLTVTTGGAYRVFITDTVGCQQMSKYFLASVEPKAQISYAGINILCEGDSMLVAAYYKDGYSFQWCKNSVIIPGATESNYFVKEDGHYKVLVTSSLGCSKYSNVIKASSTLCYGIKQEEVFPLIIDLSPNPGSNIIYLEVANDKKELLDATVYDKLGHQVMVLNGVAVVAGPNTLTIDVSSLDNGMYFIKLKSSDNAAFKKIIVIH